LVKLELLILMNLPSGESVNLEAVEVLNFLLIVKFELQQDGFTPLNTESIFTSSEQNDFQIILPLGRGSIFLY
jgi:hypothetical protein